MTGKHRCDAARRIDGQAVLVRIDAQDEVRMRDSLSTLASLPTPARA